MTNESTELTVVIKNGYQYNLSELPPMDSPAIAAAEEDILHGMQIDSIIQNLENVARLMFVAYNALGGTMVQAKMSGLQKKYLDLMDDSEQAIITFQHRSKEICVFMAKSYGWLLRGREKMAVAQFEKCARAAAEMAKKAEDLANGFRKLSDEAETVLESTQKEQALQYAKMDEIKKQIEQYNAKLKSYESTQQSLNEAIDEINDIYKEAKEKEKEAFDMKKGMMIVEGITSVIGAVIPCFTSMKGSAGAECSQAAQKAQEKLAKNEQEKASLDTEKKKAADRLENLRKEAAALEKDIQDIQQKIEDEKAITAKEEDEKNAVIKACEEEKKEKEEALKEKQTEISEAEKDLESTEEKLNKAINAMNAVKKQLDAYNQQCADDYKRAQEAAREALEKKLEMEKQRRETLASIQEFTVLIQSSVRQENVAETAVQTLQVAIRCIKQVVVALATAAKFWRSMEDYCKNLATSGIVEEIIDMEEAGIPVEERVENYQEDMFKAAYLEYICRWAALHYVCEDYRRRNNKVRDMVADNIMSSSSREEEWKMAGILAGEMKESIDKQVEESKKITKEYGYNDDK